MTALVVVLLPLAGAVATVVTGHRAPRLSAGLGVVGCVTACLLSLVVAGRQLGPTAPAVLGPYVISTGGVPITPSLYVDALSASMLVLATSVAALVQIYSLGYLRGDPRYPSYSALVSVFTAAMALVVTADDLFVLLVGWEVMGACSYLLISHHWELQEARAGAVKAFVITRLGDVGLLFGIFAAGAATGTYRISGVVDAALTGEVSSAEATIIGLLVLCGVVGKSAQFPLHSWLPDAMPGPTPISALIHAATMVAAGVFLVARLLPVLALSTVTMTVLAAIAAVSMLGAALFALAADDLKRVLAWSTVSQLAYMFAALSLSGGTAAVLHLLSHGAFKALLFLAAGSVIHAVGTQRLDGMGGLRAALPVTFVTMTVGFAALAGVPPFVGFFSKDAVLSVAAHQAQGDPTGRAWLVLGVGLVVAALTAAYCMRAWLLIFFGAPVGRLAGAPPHESSPLMTGPLVALAAASAGGGVLVLDPGFLAVETEPLDASLMLVSALTVALGAAVVLGAWLRQRAADPARILGPLRPALLREADFDEAVDRSLVTPTRWAADLVAIGERDVVGSYVAGADAGAQWGGRLLRFLHDGNLQRYVTAIVIGAVAVAVLVGMASS